MVLGSLLILMYRVRKTSSFDKDFKNLDAVIAQRVFEKIKYLATNPATAKKVLYLPDDLSGLMKYRVGDWRILFWIDHAKEEIILYGVDHRGGIYKKLSK